MAFARPSSWCAISGAARQLRASTIARELPRSIGRRRYASDADSETVKAAKSRLPWLLSAGVISFGGAYVAFQPRNSASQHEPAKQAKSASKAEEPATIPSHPGDVQAEKVRNDDANIEKNRRKAEYEDDHPKPVEDRHGDSVKKHSIAAEKNQHKLRTGVFSKETFDNHIQTHSPDPTKDFEKVEKGKEEKKDKK
ncbi:hypothetical protein BDV96DRAFT_642389 [Lophiotrema nucula]|uniref:Uncharacterized protein n=1 Tax=Lophiotrema nucula TaxID=690887 RepID=A0A6A5ZID6_9PLEO|nr:hypothetical protein BDV96DRAFT_642389 [Lophiotrema nucula]